MVYIWNKVEQRRFLVSSLTALERFQLFVSKSNQLSLKNCCIGGYMRNIPIKCHKYPAYHWCCPGCLAQANYFLTPRAEVRSLTTQNSLTQGYVQRVLYIATINFPLNFTTARKISLLLHYQTYTAQPSQTCLRFYPAFFGQLKQNWDWNFDDRST